MVFDPLMILFVRHDDVQMAKVVFKGVAYRDEMFRWILTGEGTEGHIRLFFPEHMKHFALFCISSFVTAGVWGLAFGSILLNYMNFYVGALLGEAAHPARIAPFAWPLYAVVRVVGYVICAAALARLALSLPRREPGGRMGALRVLGLGIALLVADALLKTALAPWYRERLLAFF